MMWSAIEESFRQVMELSPSKDELRLLEKYDNQLKVIAEELKTLQDNNEKSIFQYRKRLHLKDNIEKVITAVRKRKTNSVTGSDMALLIKSI